MIRPHVLFSALAALVLVGSAFPFVQAPGGVTYHLHGAAPLGNLDEPTMDAQPPTGAAPKVAQTTQASADVRKSPQLAYWSGDARGFVGNATATLWVSVPQPASVYVTLFGDRGVDAASILARGSGRVAGTGPTLVTVPLVGGGMVDREIVLSVFAGLNGGQVYYDAVAVDSTLSFDLGPHVPLDIVVPPPFEWPAPAPGWGAVSTVSLTQAHRETSLAIDPTDVDHMIACAPSGVPSTGHGMSYFHESRDGGATWRELIVEGPTDARRATFEGGDCDVAFDAAGTRYSADTWLGSLSVGHSTDGVNWSGTPVAASAPIVDRPWLVGGPAGTVHVSYQDVQFGMPTAIWYARSTDYGVTFTPAVPIALASAGGAFSWEGNLVVSDDQQELYLVYTTRSGPQNGGLDASGPEKVRVAVSRDGGSTWSSRLVAAMPNPASYLYPSIAMDDGGILHVVFSSRTAADRPIWYSYSMDEAESWSAPVKMLSGVSAYSPWVDGGAAGEAVVQWLGSPNPTASTSAVEDWYLYAARVTGAGTPALAMSAAPTTTEPIFRGATAIPEFNTVRLAADGSIRIGASVLWKDSSNVSRWGIVYQETS